MTFTWFPALLFRMLQFVLDILHITIPDLCQMTCLSFRFALFLEFPCLFLTLALLLTGDALYIDMFDYFSTQYFRSLVLSIRQRPFRSVLVSPQNDLQLSSEGLVRPSSNQTSSLCENTNEITFETLPRCNIVTH